MFEVKNVSMKFNEDLIFSNITFTLPATGLVLISGPSGAGKSTILNLLGGLLTPTSGSIAYLGKNMKKMSKRKKSKYYQNEIAFLFQAGHLLGDLSVAQNIGLPLELMGRSKKEIKTKVNGLLSEFNLEKLAKQQTATLSGGEKSRVALMRALITNPRVLICDEPTGALDEANGEKIIASLIALADNKLVIVVTHDPDKFSHAASMELFVNNKKVEITEHIDLPVPNIKFAKTKRNKEVRYFQFVKRLLKARKTQSSLMVIAVSFGLVVSLLLSGLLNGMKQTLMTLPNEYFAPTSVEVNKATLKNISGSNMKLEEMERPSYYEVLSWRKLVPSLKIGPSLTALINPNLTIIAGTNELKQYEVAYYSDASLAFISPQIALAAMNGKSVIVNQLLNEQITNEKLQITIEIEVITGYEENTLNEIVERFTYSKDVKVEVVKETPFANQPRLYLNYEYFKNLLIATPLSERSSLNNEQTSWYNYLMNLPPKHPLTNYCWQLFVSNESDYNKLLTLGDKEVTLNTPFKFSSSVIYATATFSAYKDLIEMTIMIFWIIMMIGTVTIYAIVVFAAVIDSQKEIAILTTLGAQEKHIKMMFRLHNLFLSALSLTAFFLLPSLERKMNNLLANKFHLDNLILINWDPIKQLPYATIFIVIFLLVFISELLLALTHRYYERIDLVKELEAR